MTRLEYLETYFASVLGLEYFDGPMAGVGILPDKRPYFFAIVGWDAEHLERVFALAAIPTHVAQAVWAAFEAIEPPRKPEWYPQSSGDGEARSDAEKAIAAVRDEAMTSGFCRLIQSRDLVGSTMQVELSNSEGIAIKQMVADKKIMDLEESPIVDEILVQIQSSRS